MQHRTINIATEFSRYPAGRHTNDGPNSGERFRREFLLPVLKTGQHAKIKFDGARGYGSSFLEEAFGGLVREGFPPHKVLDAFDLESSDESLIDEIKEYIVDAGQ
jgi:hypothetical protein